MRAVPTEYREFWIQIVDRHRAQVNRPPGVPMSPPPSIPMSRLQERTIGVLSRYMADGKVKTREELEVFGSYLFIGLLDESVQAAFAEELDKVRGKPGTVLRLVLEFRDEARELAGLPWEYIYFPDDYEDRGKGFFIAADPESRLILSRHVPLKVEELEPTLEPLRILIVVSQPELYPEGEPELGQVVATQVIQAIEALETNSRGAIETATLRQPTLRSLTDEVKKFEPHVVHFLGHGKYVQGKGGSLAFVDPKDGRTLAWVSDRDLPNCFFPPPRLIFLHACEGAHTDSYEAFRGVALQLVYSRTPAVVAMQYQVKNMVANAFALKFYESLGQGKRIDEAVQDGRRELGMYLEEASFSSQAFGSPVVFLQRADGIVKVGEPAAQAAEVGPVAPATSLRCPSCNTAVTSNDQRYCYKCPAKLLDFPRCRACGQLMPLEAQRCGDCGTLAKTVPGPTTADVVPLAPRLAGASGYNPGSSTRLPGDSAPESEQRPDRLGAGGDGG